MRHSFSFVRIHATNEWKVRAPMMISHFKSVISKVNKTVPKKSRFYDEKRALIAIECLTNS
jgi:hypothetical protein